MNKTCSHTGESSARIRSVRHPCPLETDNKCVIRFRSQANVIHQFFPVTQLGRILTERCCSWLRWMSPPSESKLGGIAVILEGDGDPKGAMGDTLQNEKPAEHTHTAKSSISPIPRR